MPDIGDLRQKQALPLMAKVHMTQARIREWYEHFDGNVCVSFSGGKDSTVLAHLVHEYYPDVPLVFADTGLEYPEIRKFAEKMGAEFVRPRMMFSEVISKYGYPIISKENAEAIYYARRIRNSVGGAESNRRRADLSNNRLTWEDQRQSKRNKLIGNHQGMPRSSENAVKSTAQEFMGGVQETTVNGRVHSWEGVRRNLLLGGNGKRTGVVEEKSIFNKEKWLPLCQEAPFMISHKCCSVMKKGPLQIYQRKTGRYPYIGTLAEESKLREQAWLRNGCNAFEAKKKTSQPMSFWTERDVLKYIVDNQLEIASVYGGILPKDKDGLFCTPMPGIDYPTYKCLGCQRTGCIFCGFGAHRDDKKLGRFQMLSITHPKQYEYCMGGGQWVDNPNYDPVAPKMDGEWKNWNPKRIWVPSKKGLGMKKVFDDCNAIYGKDFIKYD